MPRRTLTAAQGPVVVSEKTLRALLAIRKDKLLPQLFGSVTIARSNFDSFADRFPNRQPPPWLRVEPDRPDQPLPPRVAAANPSEAATLRLALALPASQVLIDGPIKERVKLSFIKAEGTLSLLVTAHRRGLLTAVQPMVKALQTLGYGDVLPEKPILDALWQALDRLED
jgi:predicted nucleic acid-binding protein